MAAVGIVVITAVICRRPVVHGGGCGVAAMVAVVLIVVVLMMTHMVVVVVSFVVAIVMAAVVVTAEALTQRELGGELPDGLPLVQDGLLLPHEALAQMQDGGFGLVGHRAPPVAAVVAVAVAVAAWPVGHAGWGVAAGLCFWGNRGANKFGANAIVMF